MWHRYDIMMTSEQSHAEGMTEGDKMLWANNPEMLRELHNERVRQVGASHTTRRPRLKLVAMEAEGEAATVA